MGVRPAIQRLQLPDPMAVAFLSFPMESEPLFPGRIRFWKPHRLGFPQDVLDFSESGIGPFGSAHPAFLPKIDWQWKPVEKV